ncbi:DUF4132 domain-containing protein [Actinomadura sp. 21ATH]|uniref:DUF4132 domain-containing protein n=1 Tax=Actinomadura sp. 21ATH TaxID=1735444 RepID=UPI0035BFB08D
MTMDVHPRRGGTPCPPVEPEADAAAWIARLVERKRDLIEEMLGHPESDPEPVRRARRHLDGTPDPAGAAVVAAIACSRRDDRDEGEARFASAWAAGHGPAFAACALAELGDVTAHSQRGVRPGASAVGGAPLRLVRALLAGCGDAEYGAAVERLAGHRRTRKQRLIASYLVPTRTDWVDECCAECERAGHLLLASLSTPRHVELLGGALRLGYEHCWDGVFHTMADGLGTAAVPAFAAALEPYPEGMAPAGHEELLDALCTIDSDAAFAVLVDRVDLQVAQAALLGAMERYPERAVRLLAPATSGTSRKAALATELLRIHLRRHPDLASGDGLPDVRRRPDAPAGAVPALLADPPWTRERAPIVVPGLEPPAGRSMRWAPGEREEWAAAGAHRIAPLDPDADPERMAARFRTGKLGREHRLSLLAHGPDGIVRPLLELWADQGPLPYQGDWWRPLAARFGDDFRDVAVKQNGPGPLLPYLDAEVAALMAGWLIKPKGARQAAAAWFGRHGLDAVPPLVPAALARAAGRRRAAEEALRLLAGAHGDAAVAEAARVHGGRAAEAVAALLAADPLERLATRPPKYGGWVDLAALPQVLLPGREAALPEAAARNLVAMLALGAPGEPYPGVPRIREECDRASLAEFAWSLFEHWQMAGAPAADTWALAALGPLGDDAAVRGLAPLIRAWPGESGHAKAVKALDVLAEIGTETALAHLHGIAQRVRFAGLRARAGEKIAEIAARLGLTADELGDRLVPDLGLDADGSLALDYGPRRFTVAFDERLRPLVTGPDGRPLKALPKPGAKDDPELAPAAYKRFGRLKKDARAVAADQIARLEKAMVDGRSWTPEEFRAYFADHPLVRHIARRLVWTADGVPFRIAEDRTLAGAGDDTFTLPAAAAVAIPHPLALGEAAVKAWTEIFADYEILQPFPQLGRTVGTGPADRFEGLRAPSGAVRGLVRRGWLLQAGDDGVQDEIGRPLGGDAEITVELDPGLWASGDDLPEQRLERVGITGTGGPDPVLLSEALADLERLSG